MSRLFHSLVLWVVLFAGIPRVCVAQSYSYSYEEAGLEEFFAELDLGLPVDIFPNPGELIRGLTFTDLMNIGGKALNQPDIRQTIAGVCQDTAWIQQELEIDEYTSGLCGYFIEVAENNRRVQGLTDICQEDSFDIVSWLYTYGGFEEGALDDLTRRKRALGGIVGDGNFGDPLLKKRGFGGFTDGGVPGYFSREKRDYAELDDSWSYYDISYLEALFFVPLSEELWIGPRPDHGSPCSALGELMRDEQTTTQGLIYRMVYHATDVMTRVGLAHCNSTNGTSFTYTVSSSNDSYSDYSYSSWDGYYRTDDEAFLIGVLAQTVLGLDSVDEVCHELYVANEYGNLTDFRLLITNSTLDMLTDFGQCFGNLVTANASVGYLLHPFGITDYDVLCNWIVTSFDNPTGDAKLKLDYFWFYEYESYSSEEDSDNLDIWEDDEWLDWKFAWDLLSPHIRPESWVPVIGEMYNTDSPKEAFVDFCNALPDVLLVWQMKEMCEAVIDRDDVGHWQGSCWSIGSDAVEDPDLGDFYDDWLEWNETGIFNWRDDWDLWYNRYYWGWRFDMSYDGDVSWVLFESVAEEFEVNDKGESETCSIMKDYLRLDSRRMDEVIYEILIRTSERIMRIVEEYCRRDERMEQYEEVDWTSPGDQYIFLAQYLRVLVSTIRGDENVLDSCSDISYHRENGTFDELIESFANLTLDLVTDRDICINHMTITYGAHPGALQAIFRSEDAAYICDTLVDAFTGNATRSLLEFDFFWFTDDSSSVSLLDYTDHWEGDLEDVNWIVVFEFLKPHITPESWATLLGRMYSAGNMTEAFSEMCASLPSELDVFEMSEMCTSIRNSSWEDWRRSCEDLSHNWWRADGWNPVHHHDGDDDWDEHDWEAEEIDNFIEELLRRVGEGINIRLEDTYGICGFAGKVLQADSAQIEVMFDNIIGNASNHVAQRAGGTLDCWNPSYEEQDEYWFVNDERELYIYVTAITFAFGKYESRDEFCELYMSDEEDIGRDWVESVRELISSDSACVGYFETMAEHGPSITPDLFGYDSFDDFCDYIVDTFAESDIELSMPNFEEDNPTAFLLGLLAMAKNNAGVRGAATDVCGNFTYLLEEVFDIGDIDISCGLASEEDLYPFVRNCEEVLTTAVHGEDYPVGLLRPFPLESLAEKALFALFGDRVNIDSFSYDSPCIMADTIINGDRGPLELGFEVIEVALTELLPWFSGVCEDKDFLVEHVFGDGDDEGDDGSSDDDSDDHDDDSSSDDDDDFELPLTLSDIDALIGLVTSKRGIDGVCSEIISATERRASGAVGDLAREFLESGYSFLTTVGRCRSLVLFLNEKVNELIPGESQQADEFVEEFVFITGYSTVDEFCEDFVRSMTQADIEVCQGVEDCAGVCNGGAVTDCAGVCNGGGSYDCAGECNGRATLNLCNECVGGRTRRGEYFGADQCGNCKKDPDYTQNWDCAGTCNGTAFRDKCRSCVGGITGLTEDYSDGRLDCRGICDGGWIEDTCGFCGPDQMVVYPGGSRYMDCSGTCVKPGFSRAYRDDCGACVGGSSGVDELDSFNICDQCKNASDADVSSCEGCDGVANSGLEFDTCGVCGGDGTDCVGVGLVIPDYIPDRSVTVKVFGAGFISGAELVCIFYNSDGQQTEGALVSRESVVVITCQADLAAGEYTVGVKRNSDNPNNIRGTLKVYPDVTVNSLLPLEVDIDPAMDIQEFDMTTTVSGTPFTAMESETEYTVSPSIIATDQNGLVIGIIDGEFTSSNKMLVPVVMPRVSGRYTLYPSVNHVHGFGTEGFVRTVYFPAPSMTGAKFSDNGAALIVTFDMSVEFRTMTGCADVFDDVSGLGDSPQCFPIGTKTLIVLFGKYEDSPLLTPGDEITLKNDSVKSFNQEYSRAGTGSVTIGSADVPPQVTAILSGPERIPSCGFVKMDGRRSTGSGARALTYKWEVSSTGDTTAVEATLLTINDMNNNHGIAGVEFAGEDMDADTPYTFSLSVRNFLGSEDLTTLTITRSGVAAPEIEAVVGGTDPEATYIADSFSITTQVTFYSACVPAGETQFEWSVNNTDVPLNLKTMFTRRLYVPANTLPGGEDIEFTVRVFKSDDEDAYVESSVVVTTLKSDLIAVIDGGKEFTVGRDSGALLLSAANSIDPDEEAREWQYAWECLQMTDDSACWSYDPTTSGYLIVNETNSGDAVISFDALSLDADKDYVFTVTVRKDDREASTYVTISAVNGNPPKISLLTSDEDGIVNDDEFVIFTAFISHESNIDSVTWGSADTDQGYGFLDFDDENNLLISPLMYSAAPGLTVAVVGINKGIVSRGTKYATTLTVNTVDDQSSTAKGFVTVRSGPTSCEFTVADYEELEEVIFLTENCVTSADAYPLTFQLCVTKEDGSYEAISEKKSEPSITGIGKPRLDGSSTRTYIMKVCDKNSMCSEYDVTTTVAEKTSFSESEITDFKANNVEAKKFAGDTLTALTNRNMLPDSTSSAKRRRRSTGTGRWRRAVSSTSELAAEQLELIQLTIENSVLDTSSAGALLDQIGNMNTQDMVPADQSECRLV